MTKQLAQMIKKVKKWPAHRQADVVSVLKVMEKSGKRVYTLSAEERQLVDEGLASPIVSDNEMEKFWNRHRS